MVKLSPNALRVLEERYLLKNERGQVVETPEQMFRRVARNVSQAELKYGASERERKSVEEAFYGMMSRLEFLPNSPTLMNAGTPLQMLSACFVIPVEDSMQGIFDAVKWGALTHKAGGGTGYSFSKLRPKNDGVKSTHGIASGPVSFIHVFDAATEAVKQGSKRRGANMGILRVDHPDILEFIAAKSDGKSLRNFNLSVAVTYAFMHAVERDKEYELVNPRTKEKGKRVKARKVWKRIVEEAWKTGDPGIIFLDAINRANPTPALGKIEATNPCGEVPLLPFESCNLGSIDMAKFVEKAKENRKNGWDKRRGYGNKEIDWTQLGETVKLAIRFLDDVIDVNKYPLPQMETMAKGNRKVGLGVMGFADLLYELRTPYDSEEGVRWGEKLMAFVAREANKESERLAKQRGVFPNWEKSVYVKEGKRFRNATRTCIAPTGTLSMIADCSAGIEPVFALSFEKRVLQGKRLAYTNKHFEEAAKEEGIYSEELKREVAKYGSIRKTKGVPSELKRVFVVAYDIAPEWHVRMQAAFQKHVDLAVSKTINFQKKAKVRDVEKAYRLAYQLECKGITVYRDKSHAQQVLRLAKGKESEGRKTRGLMEGKEGEWCPACGERMVKQTHCASCVKCGASLCPV